MSFEHDIFVVSMNSRNDSHIVIEIESLLLAQESRIEKHSKELDSTNQVNMEKISNNQKSHKRFNGGQNGFQCNFTGQGNYRSQNFNPTYSKQNQGNGRSVRQQWKPQC